jgi:UPF0755 protein
MTKYFRIFLGFVFFAGLFWLGVSYEIRNSRGEREATQVIEITAGENVFSVGNKLAAKGVIYSSSLFVVYVWESGLRHSLQAGKYQLNGTLSIPEITVLITDGAVIQKGATVVFPEGFTSQKMADRLNANRLAGDGFLELVKHPNPEWREKFWFLKDLSQEASLEGFLFPDTYSFLFDATPEFIVLSMLQNFDKKFPKRSKDALATLQKSLFEVVTLASIVEVEVKSEADRKMVADLFWRRLAVGQPLQSDATVQFVLGENKVKHSVEETRVNSPYNTYINKDLPPGPINNPGLESLLATLYPTTNPYFYFLSDTVTGETVFAVSFEDHIRNKAKHGL